MYIKYQLPPPSNHRDNNAEISIQKSKNHFIAILYIVDKNPLKIEVKFSTAGNNKSESTPSINN